MIFFEKNLLPQSDVVFDFKSNGINFSPLAPLGGEKKLLSLFCAKILLNDVTRRCGRILSFFGSNERAKKVLQFHILV